MDADAPSQSLHGAQLPTTSSDALQPTIVRHLTSLGRTATLQFDFDVTENMDCALFFRYGAVRLGRVYGYEPATNDRGAATPRATVRNLCASLPRPV